MKNIKIFALVMILAVIVGLAANAAASGFGSNAAAQDVRGLESRINLLEQRLYSMQSSISRLEQMANSQRAAGPRETVREHEINLLSHEIQKLVLRVSDVECGLLKLDERTAGTSRRPTRGASDPCRLNANAPLQLPARP